MNHVFYPKHASFLLCCLLTLCSVALVGCRADNGPIDGDGGQTSGQDSAYNLTLKLPSPVTEQVASRTAGSDAENFIGKIHVLFFATSGTGSDGNPRPTVDDLELVNFFSTTSIMITADGKVKTQVKYPTDTGNPDKTHWGLLILANSPLQTENDYREIIKGQSAVQGDDLAKLVAGLEQQYAEGQQQTAVSGFVMSAYHLSNSLNSDSHLFNINLYRNVSRIDVATKLKDTQFRLTSVHPYNTKTHGRLLGAVKTGQDCSYPNISTNAELTNLTYPEMKDMADVSPLSGYTQSISQKIYLYENKTEEYDVHTTPCLIIGGDYTDADGYVTHCYYRVNLNTSSSVYELKRNYRYLVNITEVSGPGWPEPEEAYEGVTQNLHYEIQDWDASAMDNIDFSGEYSLAISEAQTTVTGISGGQVLKVEVQTTNIPKGEWKVTPEQEEISWCRLLSDETQYTDKGGSFQVAVQENLPATVDKRSASFFVTANSLKVKYTVTQQSNSGYITFIPEKPMVDVLPGGFPTVSGKPTEEQTVRVRLEGLKDLGTAMWSAHSCGESADWSRTVSMEGKPLSSNQQPVPEDGILEFAVECNPITQSQDFRSGRIHIEVYDQGAFNEYFLTIQQAYTTPAGEIYIENYPVKRYEASAIDRKSLLIRSNVPWRLEVDPASSMQDLTITQTSGQAGMYQPTVSAGQNTGPTWRVALVHLVDLETGKPLSTMQIYQNEEHFDERSYYYGDLCVNTFVLYGGRQWLMYAYSPLSNSASNYYYWGQKQEATYVKPSASMKQNWNKGTESNPVKGDYDPCPTGWRVPTSTEYQQLLNRGGFLKNDKYTDDHLYSGFTYPAYLHDYVNLSNTWEKILYEWTSTADETGVYRVKWDSNEPLGAKLEHVSYGQMDTDYNTYKNDKPYQYFSIRCVRE